MMYECFPMKPWKAISEYRDNPSTEFYLQQDLGMLNEFTPAVVNSWLLSRLLYTDWLQSKGPDAPQHSSYQIESIYTWHFIINKHDEPLFD